MRAKGGGVGEESRRQQWDHRVDGQMRGSVRDDRELGKTMEKPSLVREKQCETREKLESAKKSKKVGWRKWEQVNVNKHWDPHLRSNICQGSGISQWELCDEKRSYFYLIKALGKPISIINSLNLTTPPSQAPC